MVFWRWRTSKSKEEAGTKPGSATEEVEAEVQEEEEEETNNISSEALQKQQLLQAQRHREEEATRRNKYCDKQRVRYFYKAANKWYDAVVVGVHYDDGPDKPYYTILYVRNEVEMDEEGNESVIHKKVEKQTTPDRLERVNFDADKTWDVLSQKKK